MQRSCGIQGTGNKPVRWEQRPREKPRKRVWSKLGLDNEGSGRPHKDLFLEEMLNSSTATIKLTCLHLSLIQLWTPIANDASTQGPPCLYCSLASPLASFFILYLTHAHTCASKHLLFCPSPLLILFPLCRRCFPPPSPC